MLWFPIHTRSFTLRFNRHLSVTPSLDSLLEAEARLKKQKNILFHEKVFFKVYVKLFRTLCFVSSPLGLLLLLLLLLLPPRRSQQY